MACRERARSHRLERCGKRGCEVRVTSALTPTLSPRRGRTFRSLRIVSKPFGWRRILRNVRDEERSLAILHPEWLIDLSVSPSPGGEGRGEGGSTFTRLPRTAINSKISE